MWAFIRLLMGFFFVIFSVIFIVYIIFMLPTIYREGYKFFKNAFEDLKIFFRFKLDKDNLYELTEKTDNQFSLAKFEFKEWYHLVFKEDPVPFILFYIMVAIGAGAIIYIIFW